MSRNHHRSSHGSSKHKSSSHKKHKKDRTPDASTSVSAPHSHPSSSKSRHKRVSFGGVPNDNGIASPVPKPVPVPKPILNSAPPHHHRKFNDHKPNSTNKPTAPHAPRRFSGPSTGIAGSSDDRGIRPYSTTSGLLKSYERHLRRSTGSLQVPVHKPSTPKRTNLAPPHIPSRPSWKHTSIKKTTPQTKKHTSSIQKSRSSHSHKRLPGSPQTPQTPISHPYSALFSDALHRKTTSLVTLLPQYLHSILTTILHRLPSINTSHSSKESYETLAAKQKAKILAHYGTSIPLNTIRKFRTDCKEWDKKVKVLLLEHQKVQKELGDLATEIGIAVGGENGERKREGDAEEDAEFEEMIREIRKLGKTYTAKMEKMEKNIFEEEGHQKMLIMQAI